MKNERLAETAFTTTHLLTHRPPRATLRDASQHVVPGRLARVGGRYRLRGRIGSGGASHVYAGHDEVMDRAVAVKLPIRSGGADAPEERLRREGRIAAKVLHPGVCPLLDVGETDDGVPFIVMPLLPGVTLRKMLARTWMRPRLAVDLTMQLLSSLDGVHAAGVVHRDVKPENIVLVGRTGCTAVVNLIDFGVAIEMRTDTPEKDDVTAAGFVVGTPEYLAPERVRGLRSVDPRADIWAAGLVFYEALTGVRPFAAPDCETTFRAVLSSEIIAPSRLVDGLTSAFDDVVMRALRRDPKDRYATAEEMQRDLSAASAAAERTSGCAPRPPAASAPPPPSGRFAVGAVRTPTLRLAVASGR